MVTNSAGTHENHIDTSPLTSSNAAIGTVFLLVSVLLSALFITWAGTANQPSLLKAIFEQRAPLCVVIITSCAILIELIVLRSYRESFDFAQCARLNRFAFVRVLQRYLALLLCLTVSAPFLAFQLQSPTAYALVSIILFFAIVSPFYFILFECYGKRPIEDDELLILGRFASRFKSTLLELRSNTINRSQLSQLMNLGRNILLKYFFLPKLIASAIHFWSEWEHYALIAYPYLNRVTLLSAPETITFVTLVQICLIQLCSAAGTTVAFIGYLLSMRLLGNQVRSTDKTLSGWFFMLICYQPFCILQNVFFARIVITWPDQLWHENFAATFVLSSSVACFVMLNTYADISLGTRFSNVSYRGVVQHGLYRIVRHPAYTMKLLGWAIALVPSMMSPIGLIQGIFGWLALSALYVMRALTEERHLQDFSSYRTYSIKVKYRFIPGIV